MLFQHFNVDSLCAWDVFVWLSLLLPGAPFLSVSVMNVSLNTVWFLLISRQFLIGGL